MCMYGCCGCGKCNGKGRYSTMPAGACFYCGHVNASEAVRCENCGKILPKKAGVVSEVALKK